MIKNTKFYFILIFDLFFISISLKSIRPRGQHFSVDCFLLIRCDTVNIYEQNIYVLCKNFINYVFFFYIYSWARFFYTYLPFSPLEHPDHKRKYSRDRNFCLKKFQFLMHSPHPVSFPELSLKSGIYVEGRKKYFVISLFSIIRYWN